MMKVLTLIVSSFILIPNLDASYLLSPLCGCKPDITKICASNGKTYDSACAMKCDYNYVGLYMVKYGACEDNDPIPVPVDTYPPSYQPDQYQPNPYYPYYPQYPLHYNVPPPPLVPQPPPPPQYRYIYYPPPSVPSVSPGASRPLIGSAPPHGL